MVPPPWQAVSPQGINYYLYDHAQIAQIARENDIKTFDLEFQVGYERAPGVLVKGNCENPEHAGGWTARFRLVWLQHVKTGRVVFVHGRRKDWCTRHAQSDPEMPFRWDDFRKLCTGSYKGGNKPYQKWADHEREERRRERRSLSVRDLRTLAEKKRAARFAVQDEAM